MKKGIKKTLVLILCLAMVFTAMALPVFADGDDNEVTPVSPIDYDGTEVKFVKADLTSTFGMLSPRSDPAPTFKLSADGTKVHLAFTPSNLTVYAGFYIEADTTIPSTWDENKFIAAKEDGTYDFVLDASYCGKAWPVAPVKKSDMTATTGAQYYLAIPAKDKLEQEESEFSLSGVTRVYGKTRYLTAMKQADVLKKILGAKKFDNIIVATGTGYADALAGAYLGYVKEAPILLVHSSVVSDVNNYIRENIAENGTVYLLGGESIVPDEVTAGIEGITTTRLAGKDRYKTNIAILNEAGVTDQDIIVCTGNGFADSLSASAAKLPVLLVNGSLNEEQSQYLKSLQTKKYYLAGGTGVLSEALENDIKDNYGTVERLGGANRFETSIKVAEAFFEEPEGAVAAYAMDYPDGLCGGIAAAYLNAPLLLVENNNTGYAVNYAADKVIDKGFVLGGPKLVSDEAVKAVFRMTADDEIIEME